MLIGTDCMFSLRFLRRDHNFLKAIGFRGAPDLLARAYPSRQQSRGNLQAGQCGLVRFSLRLRRRLMMKVLGFESGTGRTLAEDLCTAPQRWLLVWLYMRAVVAGEISAML